MIGCDIEWWTVISMEQRRFKYKATPACDAGAEQLSDNTGIKTVASAHILFSDIIEEKKNEEKKVLAINRHFVQHHNYTGNKNCYHTPLILFELLASSDQNRLQT